MKESSTKKTQKRIGKLIPHLDAFFQKEDKDVDLSKCRHGYILTVVVDDPANPDGISCTSIKGDVGVSGDYEDGFEAQYEKGGFITPLLSLIHNNVPVLCEEAVGRVSSLINATELLNKIESATGRK